MFIAKIVYNLSSTKLLLWVLSLVALFILVSDWPLYCTVQGLKYTPMVISLAVRFRELIGCVSMTFGGASNSNVADSLNGTYLGPFT